jgi:hypothetical protein
MHAAHVYYVKINRTRRPNHPFAALKTDGRNLVSWITPDDTEVTRTASPRLRDATLFGNKLTRQSAKYHNRVHYEGYYWFAGTGRHVWHDSMEEFYAVMWLDHQQAITNIAAQPFHLLFADGTHHYPDYIAQHRNGDRIVYDIRPEHRIDEDTAATFAKTATVCEAIGWQYRVITGQLTRVQRHNLEVVAGYRHPRLEPPEDITEAIRAALTEPTTLRELLSLLGPKRPGAYIHIPYHLVWNRTIEFDTTRPLTFDTHLWNTHQ